MTDSADDLILSMQHLEAQAKATREADGLRDGVERLKTAAQKLAYQAHRDVAAAEKSQADAEAQLEQIMVGGVQSEEAPAFVAARNQAEGAKKLLVGARAKLNFALDQMNEVERREYEAFHAEVRAETHGQLAEDPQFTKP